MNDEQPSLKRPRSPTEPHALPAAKIPRTATNHLQINYLVRQHEDVLPLVTVKDQLPEIARLLTEYDGVLQRHESLAGNLGARPVGPILIKRFEKMFDGPPKILKAHTKEAHVTWLDVAEFAENYPRQFNLERTRNGIRVCQFYTKQCRVEISEEDFVLIASGHPQKLIPPQPIKEDEDKELGVMDLLDRNLGQVIQLADQVSGRARQLIHKMKGRRTAILARRDTEIEGRKPPARVEASPASPVGTNGVSSSRPVRSIEVSQSPPVGFTAVNLRQPVSGDHDRRPVSANEAMREPADDLRRTPSASNITIINGRSVQDASPLERAELMKSFLTSSEKEAGLTEDTIRRASLGSGTARTQAMQAQAENPRSRSIELPSGSSSTVAIPNTPASLMPQGKPPQSDRDDGGPFKTEMVRRMDNMWKGDRVMPPCDRCRRLHMDCLKNLTACMGCTKKHAKCSWKEVQADELEMPEPPPRDKTTTPVPSPPAIAPPLSAGSTIEVNRPAEDLQRTASIARASLALDLAGESTDTPEKGDIAEAREETTRSEPIPPTTSASKFDVRPPPLVQELHDAATRRSPSGPVPFATFSPRIREKAYEDDDEGDRLQALAAQVYRSASQGGHRA